MKNAVKILVVIAVAELVTIFALFLQKKVEVSDCIVFKNKDGVVEGVMLTEWEEQYPGALLPANHPKAAGWIKNQYPLHKNTCQTIVVGK